MSELSTIYDTCAPTPAFWESASFKSIRHFGLAKRWQQARTGMVVAKCGTGKEE